MKAVILCGGYGTRLSEETDLRPKPMVKIGEKPILWHIMKIYEKFRIIDFELALGYKSDVIKEYFLNYTSLNNDFKINTKSGDITTTSKNVDENWNINLVYTGLDTMTGGRLLRLKSSLNGQNTFLLTYGDGISDINISELVKFHNSHGKIATLTAVRPPVRFGELLINKNKVQEFKEKPQAVKGWINGGFFVFNKEIFDFIDGDETMLEREPLERLAGIGELMAFKHSGYWQCMDTIREKQLLENLWKTSNAPWAK